MLLKKKSLIKLLFDIIIIIIFNIINTKNAIEKKVISYYELFLILFMI